MGGCQNENRMVAPNASKNQMRIVRAEPPDAFTGGGIGDWRSRMGVTVAEAVEGALMLGENSTIQFGFPRCLRDMPSSSGAGSLAGAKGLKVRERAA